MTLPDAAAQPANDAELDASEADDPKPSPDDKAQLLKAANDERIYWRPFFAWGMVATFVFVVVAHVVTDVDADRIGSMIVWRFFTVGLPIGAILWLVKTAHSNGFAMLAAGSVGNKWDVSSVIAKCADVLRNLFMRKEQTTEDLERLRLKQLENSKSSGSVVALPAPPAAAKTPPPKNKSERPAADKKSKVGEKKPTKPSGNPRPKGSR